MHNMRKLDLSMVPLNITEAANFETGKRYTVQADTRGYSHRVHIMEHDTMPTDTDLGLLMSDLSLLEVRQDAMPVWAWITVDKQYNALRIAEGL